MCICLLELLDERLVECVFLVFAVSSICACDEGGGVCDTNCCCDTDCGGEVAMFTSCLVTSVG